MDKEDDDMSGAFLIAFVVLLVVVLISIIAEVGILGYAYFSADKVECNWGWCTFTTVRQNSTSIVSRDCFENGVRIDCDDFVGMP